MSAEERRAQLEREPAGDTDPEDVPPGSYGTWILRIPGNGPDLTVTIDPLTTKNCDHR